MQNTGGLTASTHKANSDTSSPIIFQSFASSCGIDAANRASPTNVIFTPVYYAALDAFSDNTENKRSPALNDCHFRIIDNPHDENELSLVNNTDANQLATNERGHGNSRDKNSPIICAEDDNEGRAVILFPNFAPSNHVTGEVELQTSNSDSPGSRTEKPIVDIDYIGLYQRLCSEEKCRNGDGRRKNQGLYCNESSRKPNSLAPHYGLGLPNARHDTSVNATNDRIQLSASNFSTKEITTDLEFGTNAVDIFERELSEDELTLDFEASSYILFPERYGNIFPVNNEGGKKKNLNWERSMKPYRDESDEGENSVRVDEEECVSEYWSNEKEEENAGLQSGESSENGLLHASQGHEDSVKPQISAKQLQTTAPYVQSNVAKPMELPQNLSGKVITAAGPIGHRTKINTPQKEQSCAGVHHPLYEKIAERRREHAPFVSYCPQNGHPYGITSLTETPLPPHADHSTKKRQETTARREIKRAVRNAMCNGVRERANLGRGKRGQRTQNQAERANDGVLKAFQETPLLAENVIAATPATVAAGNLAVNMAPNRLGNATSPSPAQPEENQINLSALRGRVEKSNGGERSGIRNKPATAHSAPKQPGQVRAQRNRESAEESQFCKKRQALELEKSVWTLRETNKKCKRRFEELEEMIRDVEQEAQAYAEEGAGEGATKVLEAVSDSWATVQACKRSCHRTFCEAPRSPEIELKLMRQ